MLLILVIMFCTCMCDSMKDTNCHLLLPCACMRNRGYVIINVVLPDDAKQLLYKN